MKKYSIHLVLIVAIIATIAVSTYITVSIFSDNRDQIIREIYESERKTRDSLQIEIERIQSDGTRIQMQIDSITGAIIKSDQAISYQIKKLKNDLFKDVRNYRDSTNSALLDRLRTKR